MPVRELPPLQIFRASNSWECPIKRSHIAAGRCSTYQHEYSGDSRCIQCQHRTHGQRYEKPKATKTPKILKGFNR